MPKSDLSHVPVRADTIHPEPCADLDLRVELAAGRARFNRKVGSDWTVLPKETNQ